MSVSIGGDFCGRGITEKPEGYADSGVGALEDSCNASFIHSPRCCWRSR